MSNDNKKTMMGWAPNAAPPTPGQPQQPAPPPWGQQPPAPQPPAPQPWEAQQPPAPQPPAPQPWTPPGAPQQQPPWGAQPPMPQQPPPPQWGAPPPGQQPPPPQWGAPPPGQQPPPPQWGAPPPGQQPPPPQWGAPPPQQGQQPPWGAPPPGQQPPPMQPSWGGPPAQFGAPTGVPFGNQSAARRGIQGADATQGSSARLRFIRLTYIHLFGAILGFIALEYFLLKTTGGQKIAKPLVDFALGTPELGPAPRWHWGVVLAVFTALSFVAHYLAENTRSKPLHYLGLVLYTIGEALIFVPLLTIVVWVTADMVASGKGDPNIIRDAAYITLGVFGALTASVFIFKKDFSFLRTALVVGGAAAAGLIVLSLVFGFNLGIVFSIAMVLLAAGQILYETSQIMAHEDPENYVGASLSLFASVALLFWYVIRILLKLRSE
jgi:FtsH-binding integral membrane protein